MSSIPMPDWSPLPYTFTDLPFERLPPEAQNFLERSGLHPTQNYDTNTINMVLHQRAEKLYRTLEGVHTAIVSKRRELAAMDPCDIPWDELDTLGDAPCDPNGDKCKYLLLQVVTVLYPELCDHLNDFMLDMDALVWLDVAVRLGTPDVVPPELMHEYRTLKSQPVLDASFNALAQLDADVFRRDSHRLAVEREEALMDALQEIRNTPPPVYLAEIGDEEEVQVVLVQSVSSMVEKSPRCVTDGRGDFWVKPSTLFDCIGSCPVFPVL